MAKRVVNVRLDPEHVEALDQIAEQNPEASRASVIRMSVRRFLEELGEGDLTMEEIQKDLFSIEPSS